MFTSNRLLATASSTDANFVSFDVEPWVWAVFCAFLGTLLVADLLLVHRRPHAVPLRKAVIETALWVSMGLSFTLVMWWWQGGRAAGEYLSGYLIEQSLSVDNVFVWAIIFSYFGVPSAYRFRVLFWGVFGALVLRAGFVFAGVALVERFEWILYGFGLLLLYTAWKISRHKETEVHPDRNIVLRLVNKVVPSTNEYDGQKIFTRKNGKRIATPLFAVLVVVETTDLIFAIDSIPAVLAVSREEFIVFSSNAFAICGLRALYFCIAGAAERFAYLERGLAVILAFVGIKMLMANVYHIPTAASLLFIVLVLAVSIIASLRAEGRVHLEPADGEDATPQDQSHS